MPQFVKYFIFCLLSLQIVHGLQTNHDYPCPLNFELINGQCYHFPDGSGTNYETADSLCKALESEMAPPNYDISKRLIQAAAIHNTIPNVWLPVYRERGFDLHEDLYYTDGITIPFEWSDHEPNNLHEQQRCIAYSSYSNSIYDTFCYDQNYFICKTKKISKKMPSSKINCHVSIDDYCYEFSFQKMTFTGATRYCQGKSQLIVPIAKYRSKFKNIVPGSSIWLPVKRIHSAQSKANWTFFSGLPMDWPWLSGNPSDDSDQACVVYDFLKKGAINVDCNERAYFFCGAKLKDITRNATIYKADVNSIRWYWVLRSIAFIRFAVIAILAGVILYHFILIKKNLKTIMEFEDPELEEEASSYSSYSDDKETLNTQKTEIQSVKSFLKQKFVPIKKLKSFITHQKGNKML